MNNILRKKSNDHTYSHAEFVKDCLEKKINVSKELKINLLERKINEEIKKDKK